MKVMIQDLLDLSRVNSHGGNFQEADLNQIASEVVNDLEARLLATRGQVIVNPMPSVIPMLERRAEKPHL